MDWTEFINAGTSLLKKYRYALVIVLTGIILLTIPDKKAEDANVITSEPTKTVQPGLEESLCAILSLIDGAGKTEVLLTQAQGEQILYQADEDISSGSHSTEQRRDTVLITGDNRMETGLVKQVISPQYRGAVVVCQGAEDPKVCLAIVEAVMCVTGLTSDRIMVLKMK